MVRVRVSRLGLVEALLWHACSIAARTSGGLERLSAGPSEPSLSIVYETTSSISASTGADRAASPSELHRSAGRLAWRCDDGCTIDGAYQAERTSASTARDTSRRYRDCLLAAIRRDGCRIPPAPARASLQKRVGKSAKVRPKPRTSVRATLRAPVNCPGLLSAVSLLGKFSLPSARERAHGAALTSSSLAVPAVPPPAITHLC